MSSGFPSQPDPEFPVQTSSSCFPKTREGSLLCRDGSAVRCQEQIQLVPCTCQAGTAFPHVASNTDGPVTLASKHVSLCSCRRSGVVGSTVACLCSPAKEQGIAGPQGSKEGNHGNHGDRAGGPSPSTSELQSSEGCRTCRSLGASSCLKQHYPRAFISHCDFLWRK